MYVYVNMQVCILLHISIIHVCYIKFSVYTCMCMVISISIYIYVCVCVCVCAPVQHYLRGHECIYTPT